ncbi:MAG: 4-hydroxy-tetrahydrodipicolinate reductase [Oscillospiraceae bacterium]
MINVLLIGCTGGMGKAVTKIINKDNELSIVAGVSKYKEINLYNIYHNILEVKEKIDVLIDFSSPYLLNDILKFSKIHRVPIVLCTTGYNTEDIENIKKHSNYNAVFWSSNMSYGVSILSKILSNISKTTYDYFDIEILEKHHNKKIDAPSGTAILLADEINNILNNQYIYNYDRHTKMQKRPKKEIGIHSIRCGTIFGEHDIILSGEYEEITISHKVYSKDIFAKSAANAAKFIYNKKNGLYKIKDIL